MRDQIRADILMRGYNTSISAFTRSYEDMALDAANLLLPLVGFMPPDDPRMLSTVERVIEKLTDEHGFVYRYLSDDGLPGNESTFTICTSGYGSHSRAWGAIEKHFLGIGVFPTWHSSERFFRNLYAVVPPQLEPRPAVQPKQCWPT